LRSCLGLGRCILADSPCHTKTHARNETLKCKDRAVACLEQPPGHRLPSPRNSSTWPALHQRAGVLSQPLASSPRGPADDPPRCQGGAVALIERMGSFNGASISSARRHAAGHRTSDGTPIQRDRGRRSGPPTFLSTTRFRPAKAALLASRTSFWPACHATRRNWPKT
jgi:hypothetical protein